MNEERNPLHLIALIVLIFYAFIRWSESNRKHEEAELKMLPELVAYGDAEAQFKLGVRYEEGDRFKKSDRVAYAFFSLAANRHEEAGRRLQELEARLPKYVIDAAKKLALELQSDPREQAKLASMNDAATSPNPDREALMERIIQRNQKQGESEPVKTGK